MKEITKLWNIVLVANSPADIELFICVCVCVFKHSKTLSSMSTHIQMGMLINRILLFFSRGMFARPATEASGPPRCAARSVLWYRPTVRAGVWGGLQALPFHTATMWPFVVHRKIQRSFSVHDSPFPLGRWNPVWE